MKKLRYNNAFKYFIISLVIFGLISVFLNIIYVISHIQYSNLVVNMKTVEATVSYIDTDINRYLPDTQRIHIIYVIDDMIYSRELSTDTKISFPAGFGTHYLVGDKIEILYNPNNPDEIATSLTLKAGVSVLITGLFLLALVLIGLFFTLKNRDKYLISFEEYEEEKRRRKNRSLHEKNGAKIRWQYFNTYIFMMLSMTSAVSVMLIVEELKKVDFNLQYATSAFDIIPLSLKINAVFLGPVIVLSLINRFFFGKVLGVIDEYTLYLNDRKIDINSIKEIAYYPKVISRTRLKFCYATFIVRGSESFDVLHFPLYGLKKLKKINPSIKISFDKSIILLALFPTLISIALAFLI